MMEAERGQIDLYFIPTGIQWHARMAIAAMQAGANVLVEKPLAGSLEDVETVQRCERETQRWVAVGFQDIYAPETTWLKEHLVNGLLGKVRSVSVIGLWPRSELYYSRNQWAGRLHSDNAATKDSPFNNAFAHFVNLALFLAGPHARSSAEISELEAELFRAHRIESFDTAVIRAKSQTGINFWMGLSHACKTVREPEIYIRGEAGSLAWFNEKHCIITGADGSVEKRSLPDTSIIRRHMFEAVLSRLETPSTVICDTDIAAKHTALIDTIHREGKITTVPSELIEKTVHPDDKHPVPAIKVIETTLDRAMLQGTSLASVGFNPSRT
jgi:predicted dehydrogenase